MGPMASARSAGESAGHRLGVLHTEYPGIDPPVSALQPDGVSADIVHVSLCSHYACASGRSGHRQGGGGAQLGNTRGAQGASSEGGEGLPNLGHPLATKWTLNRVYHHASGLPLAVLLNVRRHRSAMAAGFERVPSGESHGDERVGGAVGGGALGRGGVASGCTPLGRVTGSHHGFGRRGKRLARARYSAPLFGLSKRVGSRVCHIWPRNHTVRDMAVFEGGGAWAIVQGLVPWLPTDGSRVGSRLCSHCPTQQPNHDQKQSTEFRHGMKVCGCPNGGRVVSFGGALDEFNCGGHFGFDVKTDWMQSGLWTLESGTHDCRRQ
jgi:hypothetical protein